MASSFTSFLQRQMEEHGLLPTDRRLAPADRGNYAPGIDVIAEAQAVSFAAPAGYSADPASLEVHRQALELQNEQRGRMSYIDAVREIADPAKRSIREARQSLSEAVPMPAGFAADQAQLDLHNRAVRLQREHPDLSYIEAVRRAAD